MTLLNNTFAGNDEGSVSFLTTTTIPYTERECVKEKKYEDEQP